MSKCDTCYITKIYEKFEADTWFVNLDEMAEFEVVWQSEVQEEKGIRYQFLNIGESKLWQKRKKQEKLGRN